MLSEAWLLPCLTTLFALLAFFIGHFVALADGQIQAWYALISDGGAHPPASCIFAQLLNMSALFGAATAYIRHLQIVSYCGSLKHMDGYWKFGSVIIMYVGYIAALGISIVANFPETALLSVHLFGAFLAFYGGVMYCWAQVIFVTVFKPYSGGLIINLIRFILTAIATVSLIINQIYKWQPAQRYPNGTVIEVTLKDGVQWLEPASPYYHGRKMKVIAEWTMSISLYLAVLTLACDLWNTSLQAPKLIPKKNTTNFKCYEWKRVYSIGKIDDSHAQLSFMDIHCDYVNKNLCEKSNRNSK